MLILLCFPPLQFSNILHFSYSHSSLSIIAALFTSLHSLLYSFLCWFCCYCIFIFLFSFTSLSVVSVNHFFFTLFATDVIAAGPQQLLLLRCLVFVQFVLMSGLQSLTLKTIF